jgi:hypothetical protein
MREPLFRFLPAVAKDAPVASSNRLILQVTDQFIDRNEDETGREGTYAGAWLISDGEGTCGKSGHGYLRD